MPADETTRRCAVCGRAGRWNAAGHSGRPFCSPRCRQVDLGRWLGGGYVIAGEEQVDSLESGLYPTDPATGGLPR